MRRQVRGSLDHAFEGGWIRARKELKILWDQTDFALTDTSARDEGVVKSCGFQFSSETASWHGDAEAIRKLRIVSLNLSTPLTISRSAAEHYEAAGEKVLSTIEQSRATGSDKIIPVPPGLELMPFQKAGVAYAAQRSAVLISDEMGLGKSVQAVALTNVFVGEYRTLIICPATLKLNWLREFKKWTTKFVDFQIISGKTEVEFLADVIIINYDVLEAHRKALRAVDWNFMIVDECHYLKNETAGRTKEVFGSGRPKIAPIEARRKIFLTGTPILNKPKELWPLVKSLDPTGLGADRDKFAFRYCGAFYMQGVGLQWDGATRDNLEELQNLLRSRFMIRRLKKDVLKDLPAKRRQVIVLEPDSVLKSVIAKEVRTYDEHAADLKGKDSIPMHFEGLSELRKELAIKKVPYVVEHVKEVLLEQNKVVVFAHHHEAIDALVEAFGDIVVKIDGRTPNEERQQCVDKFQTDEKCKIFIGGIQSAGVGITLTAASTVIFAELDWVPGNITQAEDRCHRIGQKEQVLVKHIVLEGSLDERMVEILIGKQDVADRALDRVA